MSEQFVDEMVYPPKMSEGGINAYYLDDCAVVGHRPNYAVCLNKANALKRDGTLHGSECEMAIRHKTCKALALRKEELEAGRAIYFVHRDKLQEFNEGRDAKVRPVVSERSKQHAPNIAKSAPAPKKEERFAKSAPKKEEHFLDVKAGDYADALNASLQANAVSNELECSSQKPVEERSVASITASAQQPKPEVENVSVKAGMSMVEIARMRLAAKQPVI
jgi:hypothetical protein